MFYGRIGHEEKMEQLSKREETILEKNIERKKDEGYHERKMTQINKEQLLQIEILSIQRENNQMENNRKLVEMKLNNENKKSK